MLYFAYGSNMRTARLARRVGDVVVRGHAVLRAYRHAFAKRGADGTGKGTILVSAGDVVHGVAYELAAAQLDVLDRIEGDGYRRLAIALDGVAAVTYEAVAPVDGLRPRAEYVEHYLAGIAEHGLPADYAARIRIQSMQ